MVSGNYHLKRKDRFEVVGNFPAPIGTPVEGEWNDRMNGLGFGFVIIKPEVLPFLKLSADYGKYKTEDLPCCDRVKEKGYKLVFVKNVRARHLTFNRELNRVEAY
jgi:hypothetical protein